VKFFSFIGQMIMFILGAVAIISAALAFIAMAMLAVIVIGVTAYAFLSLLFNM
jgi:hypothetical protein